MGDGRKLWKGRKRGLVGGSLEIPLGQMWDMEGVGVAIGMGWGEGVGREEAEEASLVVLRLAGRVGGVGRYRFGSLSWTFERHVGSPRLELEFLSAKDRSLELRYSRRDCKNTSPGSIRNLPQPD